MSNTRLSVSHSHKKGLWLATLDMDMGEGQSLIFSYLTPNTPGQTIDGLETLMIREAHRILGEMMKNK